MERPANAASVRLSARTIASISSGSAVRRHFQPIFNGPVDLHGNFNRILNQCLPDPIAAMTCGKQNHSWPSICHISSQKCGAKGAINLDQVAAGFTQ
jgi:hypothetical protein